MTKKLINALVFFILKCTATHTFKVKKNPDNFYDDVLLFADEIN